MSDSVYFVYNGQKYHQKQAIPLGGIDLDKIKETEGTDTAPSTYDIKIQNDTNHRLTEIGVGVNLPNGTFEIQDAPDTIPMSASRPFKLVIHGKKLFETKNLPQHIHLGVAYREILEMF